MNIKSILFLFFLFILHIRCELITPNFYNNETTIVYEYGLQSEYFTKWIYTDNNYIATFSCLTNTTIRKCTFSPTISDLKKLYSNKIYYCSIDPLSSTPSQEQCNNGILSASYYPTPVISKDFKPSTKGGQVVIIGSFLISNGYYFPTQSGEVKIEVPNTNGLIDPTNITIKSFPIGCGGQIIQYYNNKYFKFQYSNPSLISMSTKKINEYNNNNDKIKLIINGENFCISDDNVTLKIGKFNGLQLNWDNSNTVSMEFDQLYSGLYNVSMNAKGLISNNLLVTFNPEIKSVTSIPSDLGGIITITGNRLLSENGVSDTSISIGRNLSNTCSIISNTDSIITCNLEKAIPDQLSELANLSINLIVGGQKELNESIFFTYDIPHISGLSLNGKKLTLFGEMLGNIFTEVYINGVEYFSPKQVAKNQTQLSFTLPNDFEKGFINVVNPSSFLKSNEILFQTSFYIEPIGNPSTRGQLLPFNFNNILIENLNLKPSLTINHSNQLIFNESLSTIIYNTNGNFNFEIPMGCGSNHFIQGKIGNQSANSTLSYEEPIILNCQNDDFSIICYGYNFGSLSSPFLNNNNNSNGIKITFLNEIITYKNISKLDHEIFVIPLKSNNLYDGNISINVCGSISNNYPLYFKSSIKNEGQMLNQNLNSNGGNLIINGHNFIFNKRNYTYLICDDINNYKNNNNNSNNSNNNHSIINNQIQFYCNFINNTLYNCPINIIGPFNRKCLLNFQNEKLFNITINYLPPIISNVIFNNLTIAGGLITIIGSEFYNLTTSITIGEVYCKNVTFINSNQLVCNLITNNISSQLTIDTLYYVNITIFSNNNNNNNSNDLLIIKSSSSLVFKYNHLIENSNNSNNNNNKNSSEVVGSGSNKLKWLIPTIICPIVFVVMVIFIGPELFRRFYTYPPPKPPPPEPGFERRPYNPPNLNNRLYENSIPQYDNDPLNPPQLSFVPIQP
ncbi:hypothetical protein ACTFIU_002754 [Dictyostelium citrinum]